MKRQKRRNKPAGKAQQTGHQQASPAPESDGAAPASRRNFMKLAGNGVLALAAIGAVGWYFVSDVTATVQEHDLSKIGNGIPAIVQVHDTTCPTCKSLMRETRAAMAEFGDDELQYLVADLDSEAGGALAAKHQVGKITLLLFDGQGNKLNTLSGPNSSERLINAFKLHIERSGTS